VLDHKFEKDAILPWEIIEVSSHNFRPTLSKVFHSKFNIRLRCITKSLDCCIILLQDGSIET
ncbi:hypothetical protein, partial [Glaesserella parasuis]|uniref:hypothetical protein n=1 Tax=Glaesserella parasuis TaxID=738 RepID=UPI0024367227